MTHAARELPAIEDIRESGRSQAAQALADEAVIELASGRHIYSEPPKPDAHGRCPQGYKVSDLKFVGCEMTDWTYKHDNPYYPFQYPGQRENWDREWKNLNSGVPGTVLFKFPIF
jgi:hypothetical protein